MSVSSDISSEGEIAPSRWDEDVVDCLAHYGTPLKFDTLRNELEISLDEEVAFIRALNALQSRGVIRIGNNKRGDSKMYSLAQAKGGKRK